MKKIIVIGTGYVGLPLAIMLARSGYKVIGVDIKKNVVKAINNGVLPIKESEMEKIFKEKNVRKNLIAKEKPCEGDVFVISVPTPIDKLKKIADLSYVKSAIKSVSPYLKKGNLVIVESTIPPLTCRKFIKPLIEKSGLKVNKDVYVAHCPERILPGNIFYEIVNNDRVIGGMNRKSSELAKELYSSFVKGRIYITDDITAEFCKLIENTYRDINIAFANEISLVCENLGIDAKRVIELANKHPRVNLLKPGIGVGGHCIPIDPWFIKEVDPENSSMIFAARKINDNMPYNIASKVRRVMKNIKNPKIVAIGLTYKPDTYDTRESPAMKIVDILKEDGYDIEAFDRKIKNHGYRSILDIVNGKDCLLILVEHDYIKKELNENLDKIKIKMRTPIIIRF